MQFTFTTGLNDPCFRLQKKMRKLMDVVVMYEDQDGRVLSDPFVKLPTRRELPDYYEIIKKPVDITKIISKIDDGKVLQIFFLPFCTWHHFRFPNLTKSLGYSIKCSVSTTFIVPAKFHFKFFLS